MPSGDPRSLPGSIRDHASELIEIKRDEMPPDPLLPEKDRIAAVTLDEDRNDDDEGEQDHKPGGRKHNVEGPL
jgi:hypothetical protein